MVETKQDNHPDQRRDDKQPAGLPAFDPRTNFSILGWILDRFRKGGGNEQQVDFTLD